MKDKRSFWLSLCLINLSIVALLGFTLRSKILFSLPFIDYRNVLSAHSHFAFSGWVGLSLITLLIYDLLPDELNQKSIYQWILIGIEVSSLGMAILFPIWGYNTLTIIFSALYIIVSFVFAGVFIRDVLKVSTNRTVKLLSISAISSLVVSSIGPFGLLYIILSKTGNSILYRDSIYTFLHFQYNGFFTLSTFALLFNYLLKHTIYLTQDANRFALSICASVVPSLFLALLWHNSSFFYVLAIIGCVCILLSIFFLIKTYLYYRPNSRFSSLSKTLLTLSILSFFIKMLLQVGTIFPSIANAVYGDRPVIIGFLHLVFLGFVTFFILSTLISSGYFTRNGKIIKYPFFVFMSGVIANEILLMTQGLGILFKINSHIYQWLLWGASILLFLGATLIADSRAAVIKVKK